MPITIAILLISSLAPPIFATSADGPSWETQTSGSEASLRGLSAVDARVCWASGAGGTVLRCIDGSTWEARPVPGAEALDFRDVHAFDAERALVVSAGAPARVYRTEDGGASWKLVYENDDERAFFDAMDFADAERGFAFSDPIDGKLLVISTVDGGRTWRELPRAALPDSPEGEAGFAASGTCLVARDEGPNMSAWIGLGGTAGARVLRTSDGGATWAAAATPLAGGKNTRGIFSLAFADARRGVAVGGDYERPDVTEGVVALTVDGGATWTAPSGTPPSGYRSCVVALPNGQTWIAVGTNGCDVSTDGGESWRRFTDEGYHAAACAPDGTLWASGADGRIARLAPGEGPGRLPGTPIATAFPRPPSAASGARGSAAWDRFRGPNGTGIAEGSYPAELGPETNVVWKRAFPAGQSSPVLSATRLFLTGVEDEKLFTYAVDRRTGETVWKREAPRPRRTEFHPKNHAAAASVAIDEDTVVVFFDEYGMLAYDHNGEERWRLPLGPFDNVYGMGASPVIVDGVVVQACDQSTGSYVMGIAKASGEVLWKVDRPRAVSGHCTPIVYRSEGRGAQVIVPGSYLLDAYDVRTGKRVWWVSGLTSEMKSVPVLLGDTLWIHGFASPLNDRGNQLHFAPFDEALPEVDADGDGKVSASELPEPRARPYFQFIDLDADGGLNASEWESMRDAFAAVNAALAIHVGGEGDMTDGAVLWRYYRSIPQLPSPLVYNGVYYLVADQGGLVTTLAPDTGEQLAKERLTDAVDAYFTAPVAGDGKVYLLSESGILTVLPAGGSLEPLHTAHFEEACYATPTLEDGRIWIRTAGHLYCFGEQ